MVEYLDLNLVALIVLVLAGIAAYYSVASAVLGSVILAVCCAKSDPAPVDDVLPVDESNVVATVEPVESTNGTVAAN
jgi:hypothetical protein